MEEIAWWMLSTLHLCRLVDEKNNTKTKTKKNTITVSGCEPLVEEVRRRE